jgi:hypothetical protein
VKTTDALLAEAAAAGLGYAWRATRDEGSPGALAAAAYLAGLEDGRNGRTPPPAAPRRLHAVDKDGPPAG